MAIRVPPGQCTQASGKASDGNLQVMRSVGSRWRRESGQQASPARGKVSRAFIPWPPADNNKTRQRHLSSPFEVRRPAWSSYEYRLYCAMRHRIGQPDVCNTAGRTDCSPVAFLNGLVSGHSCCPEFAASVFSRSKAWPRLVVKRVVQFLARHAGTMQPPLSCVGGHEVLGRSLPSHLLTVCTALKLPFGQLGQSLSGGRPQQLFVWNPAHMSAVPCGTKAITPFPSGPAMNP